MVPGLVETHWVEGLANASKPILGFRALGPLGFEDLGFRGSGFMVPV